MIALSGMAVAVLLSQAAPAASDEPQDEISDHIRSNIRNAVRSGSSVAQVAVLSADKKTVKLHVIQTIAGEFPEELEMSATAFARPDLELATQLLVFFNGKPGALVPTGQYELVSDGRIREYDAAAYLARTRWEISQQTKALADPKRIALKPPPSMQQISLASRAVCEMRKTSSSQ